MQNPVLGVLHGTAGLVSIAGLVALVVRAEGAENTAAAAIYGSTLIAMYIISALYHSVPWQPTWKARLQSLDHTFIYALVAATFTPLVLATGRDPVGGSRSCRRLDTRRPRALAGDRPRPGPQISTPSAVSRGVRDAGTS